MSTATQLDIFGGDDVSSIIIDLGSHTTRIGYGQEDCPRQWWNSICGKSLHYTDDSYNQKLEFPLDLFAPRESIEVKPCVYSQGYHTTIDPQIFEFIVSQSVEGYESINSNNININKRKNQNFGGLGLNLKEHPFLLSEPSKHSNQVREIMCEIMFDKFQVPALYLAKQAMLSSFALGRASALVTDIGAHGITLSPVTDGYVLQRNISYFSAGGNLLDWYIFNSITHDKQVNFSPFYGKKYTRNQYNLKNSNNINSNDLLEYSLENIHPSFLHHSQLEAIRSLKESTCKVAPKPSNKNYNTEKVSSNTIGQSSNNNENYLDINSSKSETFELPDGIVLETNDYKFNVGELLFSPELIKNRHSDPFLKSFKGIPSAILQTVLNCDVDLRKDFFNNIILTGGTSLIPGLVDRVNQELHQSDSIVNSSIKFKIVAPNTSIERKFGVWLGGSILSSLGTFQQLWVSKQEYEEQGLRILNSRCN